MTDSDQKDTIDTIDMEMDENNLYHEETFTDMKVGSVRRMTPVRVDGTRDKTREPMFFGQTNLASPDGTIPIQCHIPAKTLPEAMKKFPECMEIAMKQIVQRAMEMQQQKSSRIITS